MMKKSARARNQSNSSQTNFRSKRSSSEPVSEMTEESQSFSDLDVIEFDPAAARISTAEKMTANNARLPGSLEVPTEFYGARDELLEWLGGKVALRGVRSSSVTAGQRFGLENVLGVGIGIKESGGSITGELALKVFVKEKVSERLVSSEAVIPNEFEGFQTDVTATGLLRSFSYGKEYNRPVPCGVSCGHLDFQTGTIGCVVVLRNNKLAILSNNHVLANENRAAIGDQIIQPGRIDAGTNSDVIATLEAFESISFTNDNYIDAAVAWTNRQLVSSGHVTYTLNPNPTQAAPLMTVIKNGRTTQATTGWVEAIDVDGLGVEFDSGVATFNDQIVVRSLNNNPFSEPGDSGSLVVTAGTKQPVGLLFAGSSSHTIANPISVVMARLGISRFYV